MTITMSIIYSINSRAQVLKKLTRADPKDAPYNADPAHRTEPNEPTWARA